jgi:hypothetical protein
MPKLPLFRPWTYEPADLRDDVELIIHDSKNYKIEVWKVTSGDSGEKYYVQILKQIAPPHLYYFCHCPNGFPMIPLEVLQLGKHCKHIEHLKQFLKERKK